MDPRRTTRYVAREPAEVPEPDWQSLLQIGNILSKITGSKPKEHHAVCSSNLGGFPYNLFSGAASTKTKVYEIFCNDFHLNIKRGATAMTVDAGGKQKTPPKRSLRVRTPPLSPDGYGKYSLELSYSLSAQDPTNCAADCIRAFQGLANECSRDQQMTASGKIDAGCGTFSYKILTDGQAKPTLPQELYCNGLIPNKYVERLTLENIIKNQFCPEAVKQQHLDKNSGSIYRVYNQGTPGEVGITIDWKPGMDFKPDQDTCVANLQGKSVDDCDVPNSSQKTNPMNLKGGGEYVVTSDKGRVRYAVMPKAVRRPPYERKVARCMTASSNIIWYTVDGIGWLESDSGESLKRELKQHSGDYPVDWIWKYNAPTDKYDWRVQFSYPGPNGRKLAKNFEDAVFWTEGVLCGGGI